MRLIKSWEFAFFVGVLALVWFSRAECAELSMPNDAGGEIVLLDEPSRAELQDWQVEIIPEDAILYHAVGIQNAGQTNEAQLAACWFSPPLPEAAEDQTVPIADQGIEPVVLVPVVNIATENGMLVTHLLSDFRPRGEAQKKGDSI